MFEGSVIAVALKDYTGIGYPVAALIVVVYSVALIFGSIQNFLDKFNAILLPFYAVGLAAAIGLTIAAYGYSDAWLRLGPANGAASAGGVWGCFVAYMGVWVLMMYTHDYARFGRIEDVDYHARINFGAPFFLVTFFINGLAGIFLAASLPTEGEVSELSVVFALIKVMGLAGLLFVWISQTRINTANYYLAAVNMESFAQTALGVRAPKVVWACVVGVIAYVLMMADVFAYILQALAWQGIFVVAWVAIALVHILSESASETDHDRTRARLSETPAIRAAGTGAWFLGAAAGLALHFAGGAWASWSVRSHCTTGKERRIARWEHEELVDAAVARFRQAGSPMTVRRSTVEHPFGTLKAWMGSTHFLMRRLRNVRPETALNILAYNIKRMIAILGLPRLMAELRPAG